MFTNKVDSFILYNRETGEKLAEMKEPLSEVDIVSEEPYQFGTKYPMRRIMEPSHDITFSCDLDSEPDFQKIFGFDPARVPASYTISYVKIVQARKHKKKRINKKWLKKYGFKQIRVESNGWKIHYRDDNTFELVRD